MKRLIKWDELKDFKKTVAYAEYCNREGLKREFLVKMGWKRYDLDLSWDAYYLWKNKYIKGYNTEKYVYKNCPEVKPIDPDWEYLCYMDHFGSHTYDCLYKGISADVKYCWKNKESTHYLYVKANNKTVQELLHGADLIIGINQIGSICYGTKDDYTEEYDHKVLYYKFPIKGIIKPWYCIPKQNFWESLK